MKKKILFIICHLSFSVYAMAWQGDVTIETPNTQLLLTAQEGGDLRQSYYGDKNATLQELRDGGSDLNFHAMPAFGTVDAVHSPALQVQHADGDLNLELKVTDYEMKADLNTISEVAKVDLEAELDEDDLDSVVGFMIDVAVKNFEINKN